MRGKAYKGVALMDMQPFKGIRICMLINNDIVRDGRVLKKARALCVAGAEVLVIGQGEKRSSRLDAEPFESVVVATPSADFLPRLGREDVPWLIRVFTNLTYTKLKFLLLKHTLITNQFLNRRMVKPAVRFSPHVVEANDVFTGLAALDIAQQTDSALTYDSHEYFHQYFSGHNSDQHLQQYSDGIEEELFVCVQQVFAPSEAIAREINSRYPHLEVAALLNSMPFEPQEVLPAHHPVRLLDQTSMRTFNNHELVIEAMRLLQGKATYTIQGQCLNEEYRQKLKNIIIDYGLQNSVFLDGPFAPDEAVMCAHAFDIGLASYSFAVPSKNLTLANRIFTYLNAGLAVAACGSEANMQMPGFDEYGTILDISSPQGIVDSLLPLIDDPALLEHKKRCAYAWAAVFSWEHQAKKYVDAYKTIVEKLLGGEL